MYTVSAHYKKEGLEPVVETFDVPNKYVAHSLVRDIACHGILIGGEEVHQQVLPREILSIVYYKSAND